jgi:hypothetical protein
MRSWTRSACRAIRSWTGALVLAYLLRSLEMDGCVLRWKAQQEDWREAREANAPGRSKSEPAIKQDCKNEDMHIATKSCPGKRANERRSWLNAHRQPRAAEPAEQCPPPPPQMSWQLDPSQAGQWAAHFGAVMATALLGGEIPHPHPLNAYILKHIYEKPNCANRKTRQSIFRFGISEFRFQIVAFQNINISKIKNLKF